MPEVTINLIGYLSDVNPGDILYYTNYKDHVVEVTVSYIEFIRYSDGYHPSYMNCKWNDPDEVGKEIEDDLPVDLLFKSKQEALNDLIKREREYIDDLNTDKAKAQVRIMDFEEQITQLHV